MLRLVSALVVLGLASVAPASAARSASVAALQVGLRAEGLYTGTVDGIAGPATENAVRALQQRAGLPVDGVAGPRTRAALGDYGKPTLGSRVLASGSKGWDVAELQFKLAWRGFASGTFDGSYGRRTEAALTLFQRWAGLTADAKLGPATLAQLGGAMPRVPLTLVRPVAVDPSDPFGPRGNRFHTGLDFRAPAGTLVATAGPGRVAYAGWHAGGWGNLVTIAHGSGVRTMYAHLARIDVRLGQRVGAGAPLGGVGSTGNSSGPHLHFEVRLRGAAVDPLPAFG